MGTTEIRFLSAAVLLLAIVLSSVAIWRQPVAQGQEAKRYVYKVVDVSTDVNAMQTTLNEFGAAGWELVVLSMGDLTSPRMVFKK
jgi:hypothetical protein